VTDTVTDRDRQRQSERGRQRQTETGRYRDETERQTEADRQRDRQRERQTERQTETERETDRERAWLTAPQRPLLPRTATASQRAACGVCELSKLVA
jgi:hypothetical protein